MPKADTVRRRRYESPRQNREITSLSTTPSAAAFSSKPLEDRHLLSVFTVTSPNDGPVTAAGQQPGILRQAIFDANNNPGDDTIAFDSSLAGQTITLTEGQLELTDTTGAATITGLGASQLTIDGNHTFQVFYIDSGVTALISGLVIRHGYASDYGGGIRNFGVLTVTDSVLLGNAAGTDGGGIDNRGTLTLSDSTLSENSASWAGGGICNVGTLRATGITLSGNSASFGGGGILSDNGTLTLCNSTAFGNSAGEGGAISAYWGAVTVTNSTLAGNSADTSGGGIYKEESTPGSSLTVNNSIVAGNTIAGSPSDISGPLTANFSLIGESSAATFLAGSDNNIVNQDPVLGPLADNGGPTWTCALLAGSPAIDAGDNSLIPSGAGIDQAGFVRRVDGNADGVARVDMGAFEYLSFLDTTPPNVTLTAVSPTSDTTPSVTVTAVDTGAGVSDERTVYLDVDLNGDGLFTAAGESGYTTATMTGGTVTFDVTSALGVGTYQIRHGPATQSATKASATC